MNVAIIEPATSHSKRRTRHMEAVKCAKWRYVFTKDLYALIRRVKAPRRRPPSQALRDDTPQQIGLTNGHEGMGGTSNALT